MLPTITPAPESRFEPFPLTDTQVAYVMGRSAHYRLGGVAAHGYYEYDGPVDIDRFTRAWNQLVARHDALRLVVDVDALTQRVLEDVPGISPEIHDLRDLTAPQREQRLTDLRAEYSHLVADPGRWPLFHVAYSLLDHEQVRVHIGFDGLCFDYLSWRLILAELSELYAADAAPGDLPEPDLTFRDYVIATGEIESSELFERAWDYWQGRADDFPEAPVLPSPPAGANHERSAQGGPSQFRRRETTMAPERWARLKRDARARGLTPSALMMAVFAEVVATWSGRDEFAVNIPNMNRLPLHPEVGRIVGEFASVSLLAVHHDRSVDFGQRAAAIQRTLWSDLEHSLYPGLRFLRDLTRTGGTDRALMPIVVTSTLGWSDGAREPLDGAVREVFALSQTPQVSLDVQIHEDGDLLYYNWDCVEETFADGLIAAMFDAFADALERLVDEPALWEARALIAVDPESARVTGPVRENGGGTVVDLFLHQVAAGPEQIAVVADGVEYSYRQLAEWSSRIAAALPDVSGGDADDAPGVVAVVLPKGAAQFAAVYGVLRRGAAYLPIDADLPAGRIASILAETRPVATVVDRGVHADLITELTSAGALDPDAIVDAHAVLDGPLPEVATSLPRADQLAYVLFTSGSTGVPKGVMVGHAGVRNCVDATIDRFAIGPGDTSLAVSALYHDMSAFDVFVALSAGATVVVPGAEYGIDPEHWARLAREHGVTLWCSVPAMLDMLCEVAAEPLSLRVALTGGDWVPSSLVQRLRAVAPEVTVVSIGGPTETTMWNIWHPIPAGVPVPDPVPYGLPIANTEYLLLDSAGSPVPRGVVGEMCCSGPGVARGYWHNDDSAFGQNPITGERMFRTGDFGRIGESGELIFHGRRDRQVQIRGHRVEPAEIEAALDALPSVRKAVVTPVRTEGDDGAVAPVHALVAHVVPADPAATQDAVAGELAQRLPRHMVPAAVLMVDDLPLTRNGKTDRRRLEQEGVRHLRSRPAGRPVETDLERVLASIWSTMIGSGVEIGAEDNFYSLGGDSMSAMKVVREVREIFALDAISLQDLLETLTVHAFAERVAELDQTAGNSPSAADVAAMYLEVLNLDDHEVELELSDETIRKAT